MERSKPERKYTDDELIAQSLDIFEDIEEPIDNTTSRMIASQFHGGQASDLYSFASTGHISDGLLDEIDRNFTEFADQPQEQRKLAALAVYVADRRSRGEVDAIEGWSGLWMDQPAEDSYCPACQEHISGNHRVGCPLGVDDPEMLDRVLQLQEWRGAPMLMWLDYAGFRTLEELNERAAQFDQYYYGAFSSLEDFTNQYEVPTSVYIPQTYHVVEADGLVYVFDR